MKMNRIFALRLKLLKIKVIKQQYISFYIMQVITKLLTYCENVNISIFICYYFKIFELIWPNIKNKIDITIITIKHYPYN